MLVTNNLYKKYVIEDLKNHKGLLHPVKAPFYERIKAKKVDPKKLHPNPEDEFSMENIGPNWEIVSNYESSIRERILEDKDAFAEPLIGVKLEQGGYMLINGHHRWMAVLNVEVRKGIFKAKSYVNPKVPLKVVNVTAAEDIHRVINNSTRDRCVTIDLDEVLLVDEEMKFPLNIFYKSNLRENAALLVKEIQRLGYDVWVYTGSYMSDAHIQGLFSINKCKVDGVVNGINGKRKSNELRDIFRNKYKYIVHVDNSMITCVNTATREYEIKDITADNEGWAAGAVEIIKQLEIQ